MQVVLPYVSIRPNSLTTYVRYDNTHSSRMNWEQLTEMPIDNKSHGVISYKANKRVRTAIDWLLYFAKDKPLTVKGRSTPLSFKLNFVTLTLSSTQKHSDNEIKSKLLNHFLTELRQKYKCVNYLWRAESQANGNIHFHIATDIFIPWRQLRTDWNRIQEKLGYVSAFAEKTKKSDPNSTDVHSINRINNLAAYLAKYCSKNSGGYVLMSSYAGTSKCKPQYWLSYKHPKFNPVKKIYRQIRGKLWGLSQNLSRYSSAKCEITGQIQAELEFLQRVKADKVKFHDRCTQYFVSVSELLQRQCMSLMNKFLDYVKKPEGEPPPPIFKTNIFEAMRTVTSKVNVQTQLFA